MLILRKFNSNGETLNEILSRYFENNIRDEIFNTKDNYSIEKNNAPLHLMKERKLS
jgi:hypothetical protein